MAIKVRYLTVIFTFVAANLYMGNHFLRQFEEFRLKNAPIAIDVLNPHPPQFAGTVDIDKNGDDEVVFSHAYSSPDTQQVSIFEPLKKNGYRDDYGEINVPEDYIFFDAFYRKQFKGCRFRFLHIEKGRITLKTVDNNGDIRKETRFERLEKPLPARGATISKVKAGDLDDDGTDELVILFNAYNEGYFRGAACFEPGTGKLLWEYRCGTLLKALEFKDLDKDGTREIILSSYAANNGVEMNGTSDAFTYVIVLTAGGKELWKKETGDWYTYTHVTVSDLDNDGNAEIAAATQCHRSRADEWGRITIFDGLTGEQKKLFPPQKISFYKPLAWTSAGNTRIYIGDSSGGIWMFGPGLKFLKKINDSSPAYVLHALKHTGGSDYILANTGNKLVVFDRNLERKIFNFDFQRSCRRSTDTPYPFFIPLDTTEGSCALVNADKLYLLTEYTVSFGEILKNMVLSGLLFTLIMMFLFNGVCTYCFYRLKALGFKNIRQGMAGGNAHSFEIIQGIAHRIKNPISTILWTAEKIKRSASGNGGANKDKIDRETYLRLADFLVEDVKTLRQQTNNILKFIQIQKPRFQQGRLNPLLQNLVGHYRALLDEKINIRLEMEEDISLSMDENLFKEAIVNVVDNAIDAMPEGGKLRISAVPVTSPANGGTGAVLIEVEDTGCGIRAGDMSQVFTPFFTRREKGTGIGLTICKRIIDAHEGAIDIHSREGFGTKIAITLPRGK